MSEPVRLSVRYPTRRSVLASSRAGTELSLFVPTSQAVPVGETVTLECTFGDCEGRFELSGKVTYHRAAARVGLEEGLGLQFVEPDDKRAASELFAFCAGRTPAQGASGSPRVTTAIRCVVRLKGSKFDAEVRDLSTHGAFVASAALSSLKAGTPVLLQLSPGWFGMGGVNLAARLVWSGRKHGRVGFGARFTGDPGSIRPALKKFLEPAAAGT